MARLSTTTVAAAVLLAAVAFFVAAAEAGPRNNGDAITKDYIFARGKKLSVPKQDSADDIFARGKKLSVPKQDSADDIFARGKKLAVPKQDSADDIFATGSKVSIPKVNPAIHIARGIKLSFPKQDSADDTFARGKKLAVPKQDSADDIFATSSKVSIPKVNPAIHIARGIKLSIARHKRDAADFSVFVEGRKLTGTAAVVATGAPAGGAAPPAVQQACEQLEGYKRVCYTLTKLPGVTTPRVLLETAVKVALGRARVAKATFDAAKLATKAGNPLASILGSCEQNYDDLVDALEQASRAMQKRGGSSYDLVNKMSTASTYAGDCDNWYDERSIKSPYEEMQRHLSQVVSVALGLAAKTKTL